MHNPRLQRPVVTLVCLTLLSTHFLFPLPIQSQSIPSQAQNIHLPLLSVQPNAPQNSPPKIIAVDAGEGHSCALTEAKDVYCWGTNRSGQIGDGTTSFARPTPTLVGGLSKNIQAVSAGDGHSCVLTTEGGVKCWGDNDEGALGNGTEESSLTPVDVVGLNEGVKAISAGGRGHTCVLTMNDRVKCWGRNSEGQVGDDSEDDELLMPVDVVGLETAVQAISTGNEHSCALLENGNVRCWGDLDIGYSPRHDIDGINGDVLAIASGLYHACALTVAGAVVCWGENEIGQLGDGTLESRSSAAVVTGLGAGVTAITVGYQHSCALMESGTVKCWGRNLAKELADGSEQNRLTPVDVLGLAGSVQNFSAGAGHTCALLVDGRLQCWGGSRGGQLGNGQSIGHPTPTQVLGLTSGVQAISSESEHICALLNNGGVKCWGDNGYGELGDGSSLNRRWVPVDVTGLNASIQAIAVGDFHSCVLTESRSVKCWGGYPSSQEDGTTTPMDVPGLEANVQAIAAGNAHTCVLTNTGGVKCWGYNGTGILGNGSDELVHYTPVDVIGMNSGIQAVDAGYLNTCVLTNTGSLKCWGYNREGQIGDGSDEDRMNPVDVVGLGSGVQAVSIGLLHTCALTTEGGVKCWGDNEHGQLGIGNLESQSIPVQVVGLESNVQAIETGSSHTCALTTTGAVKCWGNNVNYQLADSSGGKRLTPVDVTGLESGVIAIAAGSRHTCALTNAESVLCWGVHDDGQIGNGEPEQGSAPTMVQWP